MTDSGSNEEADEEEIVSIYEKEEQDEYEYEDLPDHTGKKKKKINNVNYGKVAAAIGKFQSEGIEITLPDINSSDFTFSPDAKNNRIIYGLRGITRVSSSLIDEIIKNRPYKSLNDLLSKVKMNKIQTINLIKSGALDNIEKKKDRDELLKTYIDSIIDKKKKLTLQTMPLLISMDLIPKEKKQYKNLFLFNKFLKNNKSEEYYELNDTAVNFVINNYDADDLLYNGNYMLQKKWDTFYKKEMEEMRSFIKDNEENLLQKINQAIFAEEYNKNCIGNNSKYEMDAVGFYSKKHELDFCNQRFDNFFNMPEEPIVKRIINTPEGYEIKTYELKLIAGTVLDKNKMKGTITLLTQYGVVTAKIYKTQFAGYDKQLSCKNPDGSKTILEKSWFQKGTILMLQGFRRGQEFVLKKYKSSVYPVITKIESINNDGTLNMLYNRVEVD